MKSGEIKRRMMIKTERIKISPMHYSNEKQKYIREETTW